MVYPALGAILLGRDGAARVFSPRRFQHRLIHSGNLMDRFRRLRTPLGATSGCPELIACW